jgi:hypothetical protein
MKAADPYRLAVALARPVARGLLPRPAADAALLLASLHAERAGSGDAFDTFAVAKHVLHLHLDRITVRQDEARGGIQRRIWPLIEMRAPSSHIRAEAHDCNGAAGFPLAEPEVDSIASAAMINAMRPAKRGARRHG